MLRIFLLLYLVGIGTHAYANFGAVGSINGIQPSASTELKPLQEALEDSGVDPGVASTLKVETESQNEFEVPGQVLLPADVQKLNQLINLRQQLLADPSDPTVRQQIVDIKDEIDDAVREIKRQAAVAEANQRAADIVNSGGTLDTTTPQPQDPDNLFVLRSDYQERPWNRGIQLSALGGAPGTISFHKSSGDCSVQVSGLVVLGSPIPAGQQTVQCEVYAKNTVTPIEFWQSDPLVLTFTKQCNDEGIPLTVSAPEQRNLGQVAQIDAYGGGCVGAVTASTLDDLGYIQYFESEPFCSVDAIGRVSATQAGECSVTVTKASAGAINPAAQQVVTIEFVDPNAEGALSISVANASADSGAVVPVTVSGGGSGSAIFRRVQPPGRICTVNTSGEVQAYGNTTCEVYAIKNGVEAGPVCISFGNGSVVPPPGCRASDFNDGPFQITNPLGVGQVNASHDQVQGYLHEVGYRGGNGEDLGLVTFSLAEANDNCRVFTNSLSASTDTVCKVRAYSGALREYSTNLICVPFGTATLSDSCAVENAGGVASSDFDFTFEGSDTGNPLESEIVLTAINLGEGGTADWEMTDDFPHECIFNGGNPTKSGQTQVTLIHHENRGPGVCGVRARRTGFDGAWVTKCFAYGDYQITDRENCTGEAPAPTLTFTVDSNTVPAPGTATYTASLSRDLIRDESITIAEVPVDNVYPSLEGCLFGGNQVRRFVNGYAQDEHVRTMTCTSSGTYKLKAVLDWEGEDIEQTICVRYGEGSVNAECPEQSAQPADEAADESADSAEITIDALDAYSIDERVTLTALNAGDNPTWRVTRTPVYNSRMDFSDANLITCSQFVGSVPTEREIEVRFAPAICEVTLEHTDDSTEVTRCINFGDVNVPSNMASYVNGVCGTDY